jgi:hypothetical protein
MTLASRRRESPEFLLRSLALLLAGLTRFPGKWYKLGVAEPT